MAVLLKVKDGGLFGPTKIVAGNPRDWQEENQVLYLSLKVGVNIVIDPTGRVVSLCTSQQPMPKGGPLTQAISAAQYQQALQQVDPVAAPILELDSMGMLNPRRDAIWLLVPDGYVLPFGVPEPDKGVLLELWLPKDQKSMEVRQAPNRQTAMARALNPPPKEKICPSCGDHRNASSKFCGSCGATL